MQDVPRKGTRVEHVNNVIESIHRNYIKLLIVDEADRLKEDGFELLRDIHDRTGGALLLVGLPSIWGIITHHEKFLSRIGLTFDFEPLPEEEILKTFLPKLVFPHWKFDPADENDLSLGRKIWARTGPSLRNLRKVIQTASGIAHITDVELIDETVIEDTFNQLRFLNKPPNQAASNNTSNGATQESGKHEAESNARNSAKNKHKEAGK